MDAGLPIGGLDEVEDTPVAAVEQGVLPTRGSSLGPSAMGAKSSLPMPSKKAENWFGVDLEMTGSEFSCPPGDAEVL